MRISKTAEWIFCGSRSEQRPGPDHTLTELVLGFWTDEDESVNESCEAAPHADCLCCSVLLSLSSAAGPSNLQDWCVLNEDGELGLAYQGLKQVARSLCASC